MTRALTSVGYRLLVEQVLAIVGHHIHDPLNAMQLAALGLGHVPDPTGVVQRNADVVTRGVNRIQHIVGDLLDLSRVREGSGIRIQPKAMGSALGCLLPRRSRMRMVAPSTSTQPTARRSPGERAVAGRP